MWIKDRIHLVAVSSHENFHPLNQENMVKMHILIFISTSQSILVLVSILSDPNICPKWLSQISTNKCAKISCNGAAGSVAYL